MAVPAASRSSYGARNVINAPALRAAIAQRSRERQDAAEVQTWLLNHFYRHLVGNLQAPAPSLQPVATLEQAQTLLRPAPLPTWIGPHLKNADSAPLWWLDPQAPEVLALETRLVEFLQSRQGTPLQGKLQRINAPQATALWDAEHATMHAKAAAGWREHCPDAVREVCAFATGRFVELRPESPHLREEMAYESQMMRHCLGQFATRRTLSGGYGEQYASACEQGRMRLFSFRSAQGAPHITISAHTEADCTLRIDQIKGKQNRAPIARYREEVLTLLNLLPTTNPTPADALAMGVARTAKGWQAVSNITDGAEQLALVRQQPALVRELPPAAALVHWVVAAQRPELLEGLTLTPALQQALELAAHTSPGGAA